MKRIISCLLAVFMLVTLTFNTSVIVFADDGPISGSDVPTFAVSSEQASPGENVSVAIRMDNNPGIASIKLSVQFDADLVLNSITYNEDLGGESQQPQQFTSPVTLNWINGTANTYGDMVYATLNFTVSENAAIGMHTISVTYDEDDVYNIAEKNVAFGIVNGGADVVIRVAGLSLDHSSATVKTGDVTYVLTPVFDPTDATNKNVSWKSSDNSVATVENGTVTLLKKGDVIITATSEDGGFEAACALTVLCSHLVSEDIPAVESTCIMQGHEAYTICKECGEIIAGSDALLPYAEHKYAEVVQPRYLKSSATCVSPAVYYKSCSVCGNQGTDTFEHGEVDPHNHVGGTHLENKEDAACSKAGYTGDTVCDSCSQVIEYGSVIEKLAHLPKAPVRENETPASCETAGEYDEVVYCSVCGEELSREKKTIPALGHDYGEPEWTWNGFDSAEAVFTCSRDNSHQQKLTAVITSEVTQEPSATVDGERKYTATVNFNGKEYTDAKTEVIPKGGGLLGDADGDGEVSILDATAIQRYLAYLPNNSFVEGLADADEDSEISILDATAIQRWLAYLPTNENIGKAIA